MTNFTLLLISWLLIVVETGGLIYPINGLSAVIGDNLQTTLAEIYATWHLCDILLGLFIISWSGLLPHPFGNTAGNYWTDANTLYLFWTRYKANTLVNGNHLINDLVVKKMATFLTTINNWYTFQ